MYAWRIQVPNREIYGASVTASDPLIRHNRHEKHNTPAADHVEDEILHPSGVQNDKVYVGSGYVRTPKAPSTTVSF